MFIPNSWLALVCYSRWVSFQLDHTRASSGEAMPNKFEEDDYYDYDDDYDYDDYDDVVETKPKPAKQVCSVDLVVHGNHNVAL